MLFRSVFTVTEAKMNVYQNARAALELMARELSSLNNNVVNANYDGETYASGQLTVNAGDAAYSATFGVKDSSLTVLSFVTTTFWTRKSGTNTIRESGSAKVEYKLKQCADLRTWKLMRRVMWGTASASNETLLANYIHIQHTAQGTPEATNKLPGFKIEFFHYDADNDGTKTTYSDDNDAYVGWKKGENTTATAHTFTDDQTGTPPLVDQLPSAIRITMDVTDVQKRETRTLARTIWIPSAR